MLIRSGKIQFLFWMAFFSVLLYLWIIAVGFQTLILPDEKPMHFPQDVIILLFVLYILLAVVVLGGTVLSTLINNRFYQSFFGIFIVITLVTFLVTKSMFG